MSVLGCAGHADFTLPDLLCSPDQTLDLSIQSHGLSCAVTAQVAVAPGTLLQLDIAADNLQLSSESVHGPEGLLDIPILHLARKQEGHNAWSPVLQAQASNFSHMLLAFSVSAMSHWACILACLQWHGLLRIGSLSHPAEACTALNTDCLPGVKRCLQGLQACAQPFVPKACSLSHSCCSMIRQTSCSHLA